MAEVFLKTVDSFYKESATIFKECDEILENYRKGKDITDDLREFKLRQPSIFALIDGIFHKEVDLEDKLDRAGIEEEKREKIREFKKRFAGLSDEIDLFVLAELGIAI